MNKAMATAKNVGKAYGEHWALKDINLEIMTGEIVGFVGPNGCGKTTLIKILAGLITPTEGTINVPKEGLIPGSAGIGLAMESAPFAAHLSGYKNLELLAYIKNVISTNEIKQAIQIVGLDPGSGKKVGHYSFGMRQRLALAQAIMERPRLLLLDEPTNGLDAQAIIELRDTLKSLAKENGIAIFLASHLLTEVENVCDRVLMVKQGKIKKTFNIKSDNERVPVIVQTTDASDIEKLLIWLKAHGQTYQVIKANEVSIDINMPVPKLVNSLVQANINIEGIIKKAPTLEEEFISLLIKGE
ncbi:MAG: ABC transporter ATP-binding protein [Dethiobacter sp.]|nr:ABC transporter ATP-binding protein [Dethiobacter sp.]